MLLKNYIFTFYWSLATIKLENNSNWGWGETLEIQNTHQKIIKLKKHKLYRVVNNKLDGVLIAFFII